jgi:division protein CdvB (Snf7/Vps24/ESCRT-III family)
MMGDIAYLVHPIKSVVATVGQQIQHMMPDVSFELSQINESLEGIMRSAGDITESAGPQEVHSPEADKILQEAYTLAEQKIKTRFPDLQPTPSVVPSGVGEQTSQGHKMPPL